jgi:SET domain
MPLIQFFVVFFFFLTTIFGSSLASEKAETGECRNDTRDAVCSLPPATIDCDLYLSASTIPNAGLGIFAGKDFVKGQYIGRGDVCIPFIDMYHHINLFGVWENETHFPSTPHIFNPFRDYFWSGQSMGMFHGETASLDSEAYCPGLDCAINCHLGLINVEKSVPNYLYPDALHPGNGAYSYYHIQPPPTGNIDPTVPTHTTNVLRNIPAGGELFKHYGDAWFTSRPTVFGNIPLTSDYGVAEELLQRFVALSVVQTDLSHSSATRMIQDLYEQVLVHTMQRLWDARVLNAFPPTYSEIRQARLQPRSATDDDDEGAEIIAAALQSQLRRPLAELQQSGVCIDHIRPDRSTLLDAGYGAFATRFLPKGTIITASPLHHIPYPSNFVDIYRITKLYARNTPYRIPEPDEAGTPSYRLLDDVQGKQLIYNYCYGHAESTLLLCPYGSGINYINHHHDSAYVNVRLEWVQSPELVQTFRHNVTALTQGTVADLALTELPQLAIQYVTLRDIRPDEELFMDYGPAWEAEWQRHVKEFQAQYPSHDDRYLSAVHWNALFGRQTIRTELEQRYDPYPSHLQVRCHRVLLLYPAGNSQATYVWSNENYGIPCRIVDRFRDPDPFYNDAPSRDAADPMELYTVLLEWPEGSADEIHEETSFTWIQRTDVPRSAMKFFDLPYSNDMHMPIPPFRQPIHLSDDLFPSQWRNFRS